MTLGHVSGALANPEKLDLEELEVYGSEDMDQTQVKQYTFEVGTNSLYVNCRYSVWIGSCVAPSCVVLHCKP